MSRLARWLRWVLLGVAPAVLPWTAEAQQWNDEGVRALVSRAVERRTAREADSVLSDYRARAHGFLFFLGQLGDGLTDPPRLIKSDQLELEVYWKAPGASKQRIIGWRDRADLPTDIRYHRDHLGIVTNNFGNRIGLGHNDEVNDVVHPLSPEGLRLYDYALTDSLTIRLPARSVRVYQVQTRPRDLDQAGVIGMLYLDAADAALVRFRFNFTRSAYVDPTLEDITILLENGLWEGRHWLPRHQEIEIRRRTALLDLPARGIIRGLWTIDEYEFNLGLPDGLFAGPEIVAVSPARRDSFPWGGSLNTAIREATDLAPAADLQAIRSEVRQLAQDRVLSGLAATRLGAASLSDIVHFNRVEGLALGAGWVLRPGPGPVEIRGWGSYGFSDRRAKGRVSVRYRVRRVTLEARGARELRDIGEHLVIAPVLNSLLAQEVGNDYGDYVLATGARVAVRVELDARHELELRVGLERIAGVAQRAQPVSGTFRPNPDLGLGTLRVASLRFQRRAAESMGASGASAALEVEAGSAPGVRYVRVRGAAGLRVPFGGTDVWLQSWAGWGSSALPAHRSFVAGGRATLISEPFRAWGGRYAAFSALEWRIPTSIPSLRLGPLAASRRIVLAPFVAAAVAGGQMTQAVPWANSNGVRPVLGLGVEWLYGVLRTDVAVSVRDPRVGIVVDIQRGLWGVL